MHRFTALVLVVCVGLPLFSSAQPLPRDDYRPGGSSATGLVHWLDRSTASVRRLAERGNLNAQYELGRRYANGDAIEQDIAAAYYWYSLAADQGHRAALSGADYLRRFLPHATLRTLDERLRRDSYHAESRARPRYDAGYDQRYDTRPDEVHVLDTNDRDTGSRAAGSGEAPIDVIARVPRATNDPTPTTTHPAERDRESVRLIQRALSSLGYQPGPIDGLYGPQTRDAVRRYQRRHSLIVDGRASLDLMDHLAARLQGRLPSESRLSVR